ncbi:MAG: cobyrinate a,c-diamide synthase [Pseudomonadota bacterium]
MHGLLIAAPASGQGKTTVTLGLLRALRRRGVSVASAKSGPDFIDPAFHAAATGKLCLTLDPWAADAAQVRGRANAAEGEVLVVEGAMGLWDGAASGGPVGDASSATVAKALGLPVVLVVDAARMGQGVAALLHGMMTYDPDIEIAGVILNRVGSDRHEAMLRRAAETVCTVFGCLRRDTSLSTPSRHLGLVQAGEREDLDVFLDAAADHVEAGCDIDTILNATKTAKANVIGIKPLPVLGQRIAVARDLAFAFCYDHLLSDWRAQGAELSFFSPLADQASDGDADAIYLPGGYPELHAGRLAAADTFRTSMQRRAEAGAMIYGECGGYMVLGDGLSDGDGVRHKMIGLLRVETSFAKPSRTLGYRQITIGDGPLRGTFRGHEFHYSEALSEHGEPFATTKDAAGSDLGTAGLRHGRIFGSYMHLVERD